MKIASFEPAHYKALATSERISHGENLNISSQKRIKKLGGVKAQLTPEYKGNHSDREVNATGITHLGHLWQHPVVTRNLSIRETD